MENEKCGGRMSGKDIASVIAGHIGANVSPSQVSHARTFFGPCSDDDLVRHFVEYYKRTGKKPRVPNGKRKSDMKVVETSNQVRQIERSVVRMREKLTAIKVGANAALELSAPDADGNFANLGRTWRGLSMALASIREICAVPLFEMPSHKNGGAE